MLCSRKDQRKQEACERLRGHHRLAGIDMEAHQRSDQPRPEEIASEADLDSSLDLELDGSDAMTVAHDRQTDPEFWEHRRAQHEMERQQREQEAAVKVDREIRELAQQRLQERKLGRFAWLAERTLSLIGLIDPATVPKRHGK